MDVMNVEQAKVAEAAGAVAVMALERIPADIRRDGWVNRNRVSPFESFLCKCVIASDLVYVVCMDALCDQLLLVEGLVAFEIINIYLNHQVGIFQQISVLVIVRKSNSF